MRETLFRGKRADNREWVEGFLVNKTDPLLGIKCWFILVQEYDTSCIDGKPTHLKSLMTWYKVISETVGQYTGVEDKNGKKVFEGDILRYTPRPKCTIYYKVIWNQEWSRFALVQWSTHKYHLYEWAQHETIKYCCEVIGNIHDNPDLLESLESN